MSAIVHKTIQFPSGQIIQICQGDLTFEPVDAIVNAANNLLQHGGGVAGAIVRRGGAIIQFESDEWVRVHGAVHHADPAYTSGGNLPCKYVIHAVGPVWGEGDEDRKLDLAVTGSLRRAEELGCQSVSLPAISTGIFGFPRERAAGIILNSSVAYLEHHPESGLQMVRVVLLDEESLDIFLQTAETMEKYPLP